MEKKTKYRILGVAGAIALVAAFIPLLQSEKDVSVETSTLKAPAFPEQAQVSETGAVAASTETSPVIPVIQPVAQSQSSVNQLPDDTIQTTHPQLSDHVDKKVLAENTALNTAVPTPVVNSPEKPLAPDTKEMPSDEDKSAVPNVPDEALHLDTAPKEKQEATIPPPITPKKIHHAAKKSQDIEKLMIPHPLDEHTQTFNKNGLASLQKASWVIQLGSFKDKTNALRMVNKLRAIGYPAFIQQISAEGNETTRVYVGPHNKQIAARELAKELENKLHVKGIVISYQPLKL